MYIFYIWNIYICVIIYKITCDHMILYYITFVLGHIIVNYNVLYYIILYHIRLLDQVILCYTTQYNITLDYMFFFLVLFDFIVFSFIRLFKALSYYNKSDCILLYHIISDMIWSYLIVSHLLWFHFVLVHPIALSYLV